MADIKKKVAYMVDLINKLEMHACGNLIILGSDTKLHIAN